MAKRAAIVCFFVFLLSLFGCSAQERPDSLSEAVAFDEPQYEWGKADGGELTLWGRKSDINRSYMKRAFERYEELTGNALKTVAFEPDEFEAAVSKALASGDNGPDIVLSYGGANIDAFNPDENLYDFSDAVWVDDLTEVSINQTIYHGKVIGLPHWEASISGTLYNKEIFKRHGITPPRTQSEFMAACDTLLEKGITPLYLPCGSPTMLLYQFALDTIVEKGDALDKLNAGELGYADIPEMQTVVKWYKTMAERGYLGEGYMQNDWEGMSDALSSGEYAMMLCWDTWLYTDFEGDASNFGLMPAFLGVPDEGTFEGPNLSLLLVNRHSELAEQAVDFVTFMADPYNYNVAFEGIYTAPVFLKQIAGISTPQYAQAERWIEKNYRDSIAWLRIKGFSQSDAECILGYMQGEYTAVQCLKKMDERRLGRITGDE